MKKIAISLLLFLIIASAEEIQITESCKPILKGDYIGQKIPENFPEIFCPGIVSDGLVNRDITISPQGDEIFYGIHTADFRYSSIIYIKRVDGIWTKPETAPFARNPQYCFLEPCFNADGTKVYFLSNMPKNKNIDSEDEDIWYSKKDNGIWSEPINIGTPINTSGKEFYPSLTKDGTLYFTRAEKNSPIHYIYRSKFINGKYSEPELLPEQINCGTNRFNAYAAPDESFIIIPAVGMEDCFGGVDYYISFKKDNGTWSQPLNMGSKINSSKGSEWSFSISPDKKAIFFMSSESKTKLYHPETLTLEFFRQISQQPENGLADIYWMSSRIIDELKNISEDSIYKIINVDSLIKNPSAYNDSKIQINGTVKHVCGVNGKKIKLIIRDSVIFKVIPHYIHKPFDKSLYDKNLTVYGKLNYSKIKTDDVNIKEKNDSILCHIDHNPCISTGWIEKKKKTGEAEKIIKDQIEKLKEKIQKSPDSTIYIYTITAEKYTISK